MTKVSFKILNKELPLPVSVTISGQERVIYDRCEKAEFEVKDGETRLTVEIKSEKYSSAVKRSKSAFARAVFFAVYPIIFIVGFLFNAVLKLDCLNDLDNCFTESIPFDQKFLFSIKPADEIKITYKAPRYRAKQRMFSAPEINVEGTEVLEDKAEVEFKRGDLKRTCVYNTSSVACLLFLLIIALNVLAIALLVVVIGSATDFTVIEGVFKILFSALFVVFSFALHALPILTIVRLKKLYEKIVENQIQK